MVGFFIIYSRYAFNFFFDSFCYILIFFSLSHRTCYLEGIVSLLLVWSVYSYVFFLSVLFVCCYSSPSSSKLQPPPILPIVYNFTFQPHPLLPLFQPIPSHSSSPTQPHRPKPKTEQRKKEKKRKKKTTQPNPNTHTQTAPNSALEYPNYTQTAPNNYSPNSP